ncbi:MAG: hypothetical protein HLX50_11435 [Alteromonadaceae bacterium]|nr:hypothetical protein [Alteromonadaceae bacterium]
MSWDDYTTDHRRAFAMGAAIGGGALCDMREVLNDAIENGMPAQEFERRIEQTRAYQLYQKAAQLIDKVMQQKRVEGECLTGAEAIWAFKQMSQFAWDEWGISDTSLSIRILHQVALEKAQPAKLLAGLFHSLSPEDARRDQE